jgi:hypothetical protein
MKSLGRYVSIPPRPQNELSDHQPLNKAPEQEKWRPPDFAFTQNPSRHKQDHANQLLNQRRLS